MGDGLPTELKNGRYAVIRVLAEGSQAQTLEAVDKQLARSVAIKRFFVRGAKQWKDVELAEREARVLASLSHRHLPAYVDYFEEEGALCLVMEKIEGESLAELRARGDSLADEEIWRFLADSADVLAYLHGRAPPVIHRDIKPGNVIRRPDGSFVIVDFGSVRDKLKPSGGSTVVGTFGYMAPEQFQGRALPATDVYAVGATALVLITGIEPENLPHRGLGIDVPAALRGRASPALLRALSAMLEPDPDRRASSIAPLLPRARPEATSTGRPSRHERRRHRDARFNGAHRARAARHARHTGPGALPVFLIILFTLGLLIARGAVAVTLRLFLPLLFTVLALLFGPGLRRAARDVASAGRRAGVALDRALSRVQGGRAGPIIETEGVDVDRHSGPRAANSRAGVRVTPGTWSAPSDEQSDFEEEDELPEARGARRR